MVGSLGAGGSNRASNKEDIRCHVIRANTGSSGNKIRVAGLADLRRRPISVKAVHVAGSTVRKQGQGRICVRAEDSGSADSSQENSYFIMKVGGKRNCHNLWAKLKIYYRPRGNRRKIIKEKGVQGVQPGRSGDRFFGLSRSQGKHIISRWKVAIPFQLDSHKGSFPRCGRNGNMNLVIRVKSNNLSEPGTASVPGSGRSSPPGIQKKLIKIHIIRTLLLRIPWGFLSKIQDIKKLKRRYESHKSRSNEEYSENLQAGGPVRGRRALTWGGG